MAQTSLFSVENECVLHRIQTEHITHASGFIGLPCRLRAGFLFAVLVCLFSGKSCVVYCK